MDFIWLKFLSNSCTVLYILKKIKFVMECSAGNVTVLMKDIYKQDLVIQQITKRHPHEILTQKKLQCHNVPIWMRHHFPEHYTCQSGQSAGRASQLLQDKTMD